MTGAITSRSVWGWKYQSSDSFFSFFVQAGMHTISHVWWSVFELCAHKYLGADVCIRMFCVCVILMMPFSSPLFGCQHIVASCHTCSIPTRSKKSCWERSFFSVKTVDSHWHQIDPTHISLIAFCLHVCFIQKYKLWSDGLSWKSFYTLVVATLQSIFRSKTYSNDLSRCMHKLKFNWWYIFFSSHLHQSSSSFLTRQEAVWVDIWLCEFHGSRGLRPSCVVF